MAAKVDCVAAEFRKVSDQQIADTTRRTIRENVAINQQLGKMSSKTEQLLKENDDLQRTVRDHKLRIEILEDSEKTIMRKNKSNQKVRAAWPASPFYLANKYRQLMYMQWTGWCSSDRTHCVTYDWFFAYVPFRLRTM